MATERLSMRQIREILRQKWVLGRPHREVAESLRIGLGTVSVVLERAKQAGLDWPTVQTLTEEALEARLYTRPLVAGPETAARPWPDCAYIHRERRKAGAEAEEAEDCGGEPRRAAAQRQGAGAAAWRGGHLKASNAARCRSCGRRIASRSGSSRMAILERSL